MPTLTLNFAQKINVSAQVGDIVYFTPVTANFESSGETVSTTLHQIGTCDSIAAIRLSMTVDYVAGTPTPGTAPFDNNNFILFSKDKSVNPSGLIGYYASVKFKNSDKTKVSELFSIGSQIFESSK